MSPAGNVRNARGAGTAVRVLALLLTFLCLSGCGSTAAEEDSEALSGSLRMAGSTSMEKLADALAEGFMEKYPGVYVTAEFVGSGAGVEAVARGGADIGNSSRRLTQEEKAGGVAENLVAEEGIAVCVDPSNKADGLTLEQLRDIYAGRLTNWSQAGGEDVPVVVVGREAGSGTRIAFEELLGLKDACRYANVMDSTGAVMARVAVTPGAVGYLSLDAADDSVKLLSLDGVEPTADNIRAGLYGLCRPFVMATRGEIGRQNRLVQAWFDYVLGEEGRNIIAELGLVGVRE